MAQTQHHSKSSKTSSKVKSKPAAKKEPAIKAKAKTKAVAKPAAKAAPAKKPAPVKAKDTRSKGDRHVNASAAERDYGRAARAEAASKHHVAPEHKRVDRDTHEAKHTRSERPAGADALAGGDFVITRKWHGKQVEARTGQHIRVELPENAMRGMSWQLQKLPHGVHLADPQVQAVEGQAQVTQNRIFDFSVEEEGDYLLQFTLARQFGSQGVSDTFKVKVAAKAD